MARGKRSSSFDAAVWMKKIKYRVKPLLVLLSLFVVISVFWQLKLVGITLAGDAFCGMEEHQHSDSCYEDGNVCELEEHTHIVSCYSDITADLENAVDWESTFADVEISEEISVENLIEIAASQIGYTESERNFIVDTEGNRHGYTRYGEWYGNPYGDWATMFTSFCLRYSGFDENLTSSGADTMRLAWEEIGQYQTADEYTPVSGDIVFLNTNEKETVDTTAIVSEVTESSITVIGGDVENQVTEQNYEMDDDAIVGYGVTEAFEETTFEEMSGETLPVEVEDDIDMSDEGLDEEEQVDGEISDEEAASGEVMMFSAAPAAVAAADMPIVATTVSYNDSTFSNGGRFIIYTQGTDGKYYALDGNANAVEIQIDSNGIITSDISNPELLYWTLERHNNYNNRPTYYVQNSSTKMYLHPYRDNSNNHGAILSGRWETVFYTSGNGVMFQGARQSSYAVLSGNRFTDTTGTGSVFYFGKEPETCTVWLDGTQGNLMSLRGSPNEKYSVMSGTTFTLPTEWASPVKYEYELKGWYDVNNAKYYPAGAEVVVTDNTVFYAYWEAETYDIGQYNSHVSDTVSTNEFITTRVFDYNFLFNVQSAYAGTDTYVNNSGHSENWRLMQSGTVPYKGQTTLNYIFRDWDNTGQISYPQNTNTQNTYSSNVHVYSGLYSAELGEILFGTDNSFDPSTGGGIIGKKYLGEGDHLFKFMTDPSDELYGYYYYDSARNAASYNQTDQRFYVYDYLERTTESANSSDAGKYSDFLPLNSPYANTNDKDISTYTYDGEHGEYAGIPHIMYDARYDNSGSTPNQVGTNFGFGMSIDVDFYIPETPGTIDADGGYGNQDIYGKDMHFHFSGDDDVWVLLDGELILDIGGIHGVESGDINFATGEVTVNGQVQTEYTNKLKNVEAGEHVLTIYYLERGSSQSNCAIYFNLAPRFSFSIQKEDVLTQEVLNGAQFSVFTDRECTKPAELWESEEEHDNGEPATNTFTVVDGVANMWGFGAGQTYYIKETKAPDASEYELPSGIIKVSIDKKGAASYSVEMMEESGELSGGFTVHGFRIDEETQNAYIVATNAPDWVEEVTSISASKKWNDNKDHTYDEVTVYLTVTDSDGTVRRIREVVLNQDNNWKYTWTNLPKYAEDGKTLIQYDVEEGYFPGYYSNVEPKENVTDGYAFEVTNTPLDEETSLKVMKEWEIGAGTSELYEKEQVTIRLLANGKDTGRTVTLSLKNGWTDTFKGLPYKDAEGNVIVYSVEESWNTEDWLAKYGDVITIIGGKTPTYETTVKNIYRWGRGVELPATGGRGPTIWILCGLSMMIGSLVYGCIWRRKRERRYGR